MHFHKSVFFYYFKFLFGFLFILYILSAVILAATKELDFIISFATNFVPAFREGIFGQLTLVSLIFLTLLILSGASMYIHYKHRYSLEVFNNGIVGPNIRERKKIFIARDDIDFIGLDILGNFSIKSRDLQITIPFFGDKISAQKFKKRILSS